VITMGREHSQGRRNDFMGEDSAAAAIRERKDWEEWARRNNSVGSFYHRTTIFRNFVHSAREKKLAFPPPWRHNRGPLEPVACS
jgi:hypothetical protein